MLLNTVPVRAEEWIPLAPLTLILGGAKSGKSAFAESLVVLHAASIGRLPIYLATARVYDDEMAERVQHHKLRRGESWCTVETLSAKEMLTLLPNLPSDVPVLFDCLTSWLLNLTLENTDVNTGITELTAALLCSPGPVVIVSNEIGYSIVPKSTRTRLFRDHAGYLNQRIAAIAQRVIIVVAGLPLTLKIIE